MPTKIKWAKETWNPVTGCTPVSEGCANCYAQRMAKRLAGRFGYPADEPFRVTLQPYRLKEPLGWSKPRRVFVCSIGDLFHQDVPDEFIDRVFATMALCPQHTFLVLTKRPDRMREYITTRQRDSMKPERALVLDEIGFQKYSVPWPLPNVWLGVTAENQEQADLRIPILLQIPAAVRFVSVEPMLSGIQLRDEWLPRWEFLPDKTTPSGKILYRCRSCGRETPTPDKHCRTIGDPDESKGCSKRQYLRWVICGGETGPGARPMHPDWVRSLRDQCVASGTPFFFKQWGEWAAVDDTSLQVADKVRKMFSAKTGTLKPPHRVGRKIAGRILDGREWNEMPGAE